MDKYLNLIINQPEYYGVNRFCNICGYRFSKFVTVNKIFPREAVCPVCGSYERHRHLYIHLAPLFPFLQGKRILHFAPEKIIKDMFVESDAEYYDGDIQPGLATYQIDITDIDWPDNYFDYIICSHVLEHIPDDARAMSELFRVLKIGGIAFICTPLASKFKEDITLTDPRAREMLFGQDDHVRIYNLDTLKERLSIAGFDTSKVSDYSKFPCAYNDAKLFDIFILAQRII